MRSTKKLELEPQQLERQLPANGKWQELVIYEGSNESWVMPPSQIVSGKLPPIQIATVLDNFKTSSDSQPTFGHPREFFT